ncbi:hypothetical protein Tco_0917679 [Tanacetum coccineum]
MVLSGTCCYSPEPAVAARRNLLLLAAGARRQEQIYVEQKLYQENNLLEVTVTLDEEENDYVGFEEEEYLRVFHEDWVINRDHIKNVLGFLAISRTSKRC